MITSHLSYKNLPPDTPPCVIAIGNFDGVHKGHDALVQQVCAISETEGLSPAILTFEPHPRRFFKPDSAVFRLTFLSQKERLFAKKGIQHLFAIPFDKELSQMTADHFIKDVLSLALKAKHIVVGEGFIFGKDRQGTVETLKNAGLFDVTCVPVVTEENGDVYSSTRIRDAISRGALDEAAGLLSWTWEVESEVIHGEKRGREMGFPTANQNVTRYISPPYGVYAVRVMLSGEDVWRDGVASFGIRPMFEVEQPLLETYIFDFDREIYGNNMRVKFVKYLREEMNFADITELKERIKQDCLDAKAVLKSSPL